MSSSGPNAPDFYTIGAYGWNAEQYFAALTNAHIDTFCDIRARRGVRGSEYAFVNSTRLQGDLQKHGITYLHFKDLAPSKGVRGKQGEIDKASKVAKRKRTELSDQFMEAYQATVMQQFDSSVFLSSLPPEAQRVVFFCVEREPAACHRSLLATRLEQDLGILVTHLLP